MFHRWAAPLLVLALCAMSPKTAAGQQVTQPRGQGGSGLGVYPNPFNPEAFFTVRVKPDECLDGSRQHVVTLKIYSILMAPVATAQLRGVSPNSTTPLPPGGNGLLLSNLQLGCGVYQGYWNGKMEGTAQEAASGPYVARLFVDGKLTATLRIYLSK